MNNQKKEVDSILISRAKKGDMEAFESLIRKYQKSIYYLCYRMTMAHQSADDIAQEVFIRAYFSIKKFKEGMNFYTWVRKIAVNLSLNYLKKKKREVLFSNNDRTIEKNISSESQEMPLDCLQREEMKEKFEEAVNSLPSDQKAVFLLKVQENQSYEEISRVLKIPKGTIMSRLNRARNKLKIIMADYL
ncbi:MAG: RNA polymerase sigma factor [Candidatus Aminicenantia bacterium]